MDIERARHAQELEEARDDEHLQQEAEQVDGAEQPAVRLTDKALAVGRELRAGAVQRMRLLDDVAPEEILTRGVDDVQEDREQGNEHQVTVIPNQLEATTFTERFVRGGRLRGRPFPPGYA